MQIIVLAAGLGKRMHAEVPKVLVPIKGRPMIEYLIRSIISSGVCKKPIVVVSPDNNYIIKQALKDYDCQYAIQDKQLGTGHALACTKKLIDKETKRIISFYGDHPFVKADTIKKLASCPQGIVTIMTTVISDFNDWRANFYHWGRIIRNDNKIKEIVEFKDATEEEKKINEVNPGFYCFDNEWLWNNIDKLNNRNSQEEYYLTDLIKIAFDQGAEINSCQIDPREAVGVNTKEELEIAEGLIG